MNTDQSLKQEHHSTAKSAWIGICMAIVLDTIIQICWKAAVSHVPADIGIWETVLLTLRQPLLHVTLIMVVLQFINWMTVLARADLSYSQPITALSLVTVTVFSAFLLNEQVSLLRITGMVMILAGVWFISMTEHRTIAGDLRSVRSNSHIGGIS